MAAGRESLTRDIVIAGPAELAALAAGALPPVLVLVADLADPALAGVLDLAPNAQDLADAARPGASPRTHFHARRALTRWLVGRQLGVEAADVVIGYDAAGAPRVLSPAAGCFVSVAGRGQLAAVAVAAGKIGVDLEPLADAGAPVWDVLHPDEAEMLRALPEPEWARAFLAIWTAKEAALKALGEGFLREPAGVRVVGSRDPSPGSLLRNESSLSRKGRGLACIGVRAPSPLVGEGRLGALAPSGGEGSRPSFTLLDPASAPLAQGIWVEREGALVAVALA